MSYRCHSLRRKFVPYLEGGTSTREAKRLERHLGGCRECEELLARLRSGHEAARQFVRLAPGADQRPPVFEEIWAAIGATLDRPPARRWPEGGSYEPCRRRSRSVSSSCWC